MSPEEAGGMWRAVVRMAFRNGELIGAPPDHPYVAEIVARSDFIFAVWPDDNVDLLDGFSFLSVRGMGTDVSRMNAIPRVDKESALALQALYGSPADLASNNLLSVRPKMKPRLVARDGEILSK